MKVIDVISKCEDLLEIGYTRDDLLDCFNETERGLALDYLPLYATHHCNANVVHYNEFEHQPLRIVGCNCKFKIFPQYIESKDEITRVEYAYIPNEKSLYDECSYGDEFLKCLSYGIISEYLIKQGCYEESISWTNKYKREIELLMI